mmetsp:Transcript_10250/g.41500  ORF Transcript_10250/g.41500 Transcript_10250/m.41500 type:complete len:284 (-) Transcript_10250:404-1255(-)
MFNASALLQQDIKRHLLWITQQCLNTVVLNLVHVLNQREDVYDQQSKVIKCVKARHHLCSLQTFIMEPTVTTMVTRYDCCGDNNNCGDDSIALGVFGVDDCVVDDAHGKAIQQAMAQMKSRTGIIIRGMKRLHCLLNWFCHSNSNLSAIARKLTSELESLRKIKEFNDDTLLHDKCYAFNQATTSLEFSKIPTVCRLNLKFALQQVVLNARAARKRPLSDSSANNCDLYACCHGMGVTSAHGPTGSPKFELPCVVLLEKELAAYRVYMKTTIRRYQHLIRGLA